MDVIGRILSALAIATQLGGLALAARFTEEAARAADEPAALRAGETWLATVDAGRYGESWDRGASLLRAALTREQWQAQVAAARQALGKLVSRRLKSAQAAATLPGAPDGRYVVAQYESTFEHKQQAVETVTPMLDSDGEWRVAGYYVR